ncbi:MAG: hypothetical protein ACOCRO_02580 [Halanaerobiales bacterium]
MRFTINQIDAIAFKQAHKMELLKNGRVDIIYQPDINYWNGYEKLQLIVRGIKKSEI